MKLHYEIYFCRFYPFVVIVVMLFMLTSCCFEKEIESVNVSARVVDEETDLPLASVKVSYKNNSGVMITAITDIDGIFVVHEKEYGDSFWGMFVLHGYVPFTAPKMERTFKLEKGVSISGYVIDKETGLPVSGCWVDIEPVHLTMQKITRKPLIVTDNYGFFELFGSSYAGLHNFTANKINYLKYESEILVIENQTIELRIELESEKKD